MGTKLSPFFLEFALYHKQTKRKVMKASETIVAFHIGRGGRFYNPGHKTFIGEKKITDFVQELFLNEDETHFVDSNGNDVGLTIVESETGIGIIELDGYYDTTYTCFLSDCSFEEMKIIETSNLWNSQYLINSFLEHHEIETLDEFE